MSTAAELDRVTCCNYSYCVAVLLAEESHCAQLSCLFDRHFLHSYGDRRHYGSIYHSLNISDLFICHCAEVVEVETAGLLVDKLSSLMNVVAQHLAQSILEKVSCGVVAHDSKSALLVDRSADLVAL